MKTNVRKIEKVLLLMLFFCGGALCVLEASEASLFLRHGNGKTVALTFDDGPRLGYVEPLLDILREKGVRATFFLVGRQVLMYPELVRAIDAGGHVVANHTFDHYNLLSLPPENVYREWRLCNEAVESVIGKKPRFARPPGGRYNEFVAEQATGEGLRIVLWTNNPGDYSASLSGPSLARKVLSGARKGDIVLLHAGVSSTVDALPEIIDGYRKKGYSFVAVDEM